MMRPSSVPMLCCCLLALVAAPATAASAATPSGRRLHAGDTGGGFPEPNLDCSRQQSPRQAARTILRSWMARSGPVLRQLRRLQGALPAAKLPVFMDEECLWLVMFNGTSFHAPYRPQPGEKHANHHCYSVFYEDRVLPALRGMEVSLRVLDVQLPPTPFEFYLSAWDYAHYAAPADAPGLVLRLQRPVVVMTISSTARAALPMPFVFEFIGLLHGLGRHDMLPQSARGQPAIDWWAVYSMSAPAVPWATKHGQLVYRGGCVPTMRSDRFEFGPLRSSLCQHLHGNPHADVTLFLGYCPGWQGSPMLKAMCDQCRPCESPTHLSLTRQGMADGYRYQAIADGFGVGTDSTFWKLASRSTCFWLLPPDAPPTAEQSWWTPWYDPLLKPWVDYIPAKAEDVPAWLQFCNDETGTAPAPGGARRALRWGEGGDLTAGARVCQAVAESAHRRMRCSLQPRTTMRYTALLLRALQGLQPRGA